MSQTVFNVIQCVEQMVLNSIDGNSTCIAVRINWDTFSITVLDNGSGISKEDLEDIGLRIVQKKGCHKTYSLKGQALMTINQHCASLTITSRQRNSTLTWEKKLKNQNETELRNIESRKSCGTTVVIEDYLCSVPEKKTLLDISNEMNKIQELIDSLALLHSKISFSIRDDSNQVKLYELYQTKKQRDTIHIAKHLFKLEKNGKLITFHRASPNSQFKIKGLVSNQQLKNSRFIYVNNRRVDSEMINNLLSSVFYKEGSKGDHGIIMNIKCSRSEYRLLFSWEKTDVEFIHRNEILKLLKSTFEPIYRRIEASEMKTQLVDQWLSKSLVSLERNHKKNLYLTLRKNFNNILHPLTETVPCLNTNDTGATECIPAETLGLKPDSSETTRESLILECGPNLHHESPLSLSTTKTSPSFGRIGLNIERVLPAEEILFDNSFPIASSFDPLSCSVKDLENLWTDENTDAKETAPESEGTPFQVMSDTIDPEDVHSFIDETEMDVPSTEEKSAKPEDVLSKDNNRDETDLTPSSAQLSGKRTASPTSKFTKIRAFESKKSPSHPSTGPPDNWVEVTNSNGSYFFNTLSGNTSFKRPLQTQKLFEICSRFRQKASVPVKDLKIRNDFWVQHKQPFNVAKTSSNSFRFHSAIPKRCRFNKQMFEKLIVIRQIDKKFICCIAEENEKTPDEKRFLVLIDQHAAHERVCLEKLISVHSKVDKNGLMKIQSSPLQPHLNLPFNRKEIEMLQKLKDLLKCFGLVFSTSDSVDSITVTRVPSCFLERETNEVKRGRNSVYQSLTNTLLQEFITEYAESGRISMCILPTAIRNVLNSLACHGAIRFGEQLSQNQCIQLIRALGQCDVPFQCAHGRPLIAPLIDLNEISKIEEVSNTKPRYGRLSQMFC